MTDLECVSCVGTHEIKCTNNKIQIDRLWAVKILIKAVVNVFPVKFDKRKSKALLVTGDDSKCNHMMINTRN